MKRRINTIKGKRLVAGGDTNTLSKDEILVSETPNGVVLKERASNGNITQLSGAGGGNDESILYYKINKDVLVEELQGVFEYISTLLTYIPLQSCIANGCMTSGAFIQYRSDYTSFNSFFTALRLAGEDGAIEALAINNTKEIFLFQHYKDMSDYIQLVFQGDLLSRFEEVLRKLFPQNEESNEEELYMILDMINQCLTRITKEEYYSLASNI